MITSDSPIEKQIAFYENKINYYCDAIKSKPKGKEIDIQIGWIKSWNEEIILLNKRLSDNNYNECLDCKEKISKQFITCNKCFLKQNNL